MNHGSFVSIHHFKDVFCRGYSCPYQVAAAIHMDSAWWNGSTHLTRYEGGMT